MSQDLQQNRYDQLLRRVGGLIGPGAKVSEVLGELFPVIDVERVPGELLRLGGTDICFGSISVIGGGATAARTQLLNPVDSGKIITVSATLISTDTTQLIRSEMVNVALTTGQGTERFRDSRRGLVNRPSGQIRTELTAALTGAISQFRLLVDTPWWLKDENSMAVLTPGFGFEVGAGTVATRIFVTYYWRERVAEASELNF